MPGVQAPAIDASVFAWSAESDAAVFESVGAMKLPPDQCPTQTAERSPGVPSFICDARHLLTILCAPVACFTPDLFSVLAHLSRPGATESSITRPGVPLMMPRR